MKKYSPDYGHDNNFGSINNKNYSTMTDYAVGIDMINKFHEYNKTRAQDYVDKIFKDYTYGKALAQITGIGTAIKFTELDEYDVDDIAKKMAALAKGKVPAKASDFLFALQDQLTATPFVDFVVDNPVTNAAVNVGNTVLAVTQAAGDVANASLSTITFGAKVISYLPYIVPVAVIVGGYFYFKSGGIQGMALKQIKKRL